MTRFPSDAKQPDDLAPYRRSIRREMRAHGCKPEEAALRCAARIGPKHIEQNAPRLLAARDQVMRREGV